MRVPHHPMAMICHREFMSCFGVVRDLVASNRLPILCFD